MLRSTNAAVSSPGRILARALRGSAAGAENEVIDPPDGRGDGATTADRGGRRVRAHLERGGRCRRPRRGRGRASPVPCVPRGRGGRCARSPCSGNAIDLGWGSRRPGRSTSCPASSSLPKPWSDGCRPIWSFTLIRLRSASRSVLAIPGVALVGERDDGVDAVVAAARVPTTTSTRPSRRGAAARAVRARKPGTVGARAIREELLKAAPRKSRRVDMGTSGIVGSSRVGSNQSELRGSVRIRAMAWRAAPAAPRSAPGRRRRRSARASHGPVRHQGKVGEEADEFIAAPAAAVAFGQGQGIPGRRLTERRDLWRAPSAKLARPIRPRGREPGPAAGPAADVGRIEQVLTQPAAPLGQHQRAAAAGRTTPGRGPPRRRTPTGPSTRSPRFASAKKTCERRTVCTAQPMSRLRMRKPAARASRSAVFRAFSARKSSQTRQARRRAVAGCSSTISHQIVALPVPGLAQDGLLAGVVADRELGERVVVDRSSRSGRGRPP